MPPKPHAMESRVAVLESRQETQDSTLDWLKSNLSKLTEIATEIIHIRQSIETAASQGRSNQNDIDGVGDKLDKVDTRVGVTEARINNVVRIIIWIGVTIGTGVAGGIVYIVAKVTDYVILRLG